MAKEAGLPHIRIHDLRHSHASLLINMNVPPIVVKERLGHEKIQTTLDIYSHIFPGKDEDVANQLNQLMKVKENNS